MVQKPSTALPNQSLPLVDEKHLITEAWSGFFTNLASGASPFLAITLLPSPSVFIASHAGTALIIGGTVSSVGLIRGRVTIPATGQVAGFFPMSQGDHLVVTYTALPVLWFLPNGNPS